MRILFQMQLSKWSLSDTVSALTQVYIHVLINTSYCYVYIYVDICVCIYLHTLVHIIPYRYYIICMYVYIYRYIDIYIDICHVYVYLCYTVTIDHVIMKPQRLGFRSFFPKVAEACAKRSASSKLSSWSSRSHQPMECVVQKGENRQRKKETKSI